MPSPKPSAGRGRALRVQLGPVASDARWLQEFTADDRGRRAGAGRRDPGRAPRGQRRRRRLPHACHAPDAPQGREPGHVGQASPDRRITTDEREIAKLLPQVEELHRERDHAQGRRSELDDGEGRRIWRARLTNLARHQVLELATLRIDGELAAHVLGIAELTEYRIVEGTLATRFARYAPGRVLEAAVLQRVLDDPMVDRLDWMTSVASERLLAANDVQPVSMVRVDLAADRD